MSTVIHIAYAAPSFIEDRDPGDEHVYPRLHTLTKCPECGAPAPIEPTDEERARLLADPDYNWIPPDDDIDRLFFGFGLMGGGFGPYVVCERCGFFLKEQSSDE